MARSDLELPLASRLCLACGLCCNGTVYGYAIIREDEVEEAARIGMNTMRTMDKSPAFLMACNWLDGAACTRYTQWRPSICGDYFCRVQKRAEKQDLTEEQAFARIANARRMAEEVKALLPDGMPMSQARHEFRRLAGMHPNLTPEESRFVVKMFTLERYLDAEFRGADHGHLPAGKEGPKEA
ncbi:YkgJ family cysteine cluster protein [Novosphingobium jiangmenense]|uniref:YkgJ family cysteine cluster protein n=1 Tax=Novosphingobium jiangmenense TaxID=2791981 RepID=UPI001BE4761D|nr:YkgJ family cysteine cluster protein [Novosphingobium jiangmenense]